MQKFLTILSIAVLTGCATVKPQPRYVAPSTAPVTQAIQSANTSVQSARESNYDAKDVIKNTEVIDNNLINKIKAYKARQH